MHPIAPVRARNIRPDPTGVTIVELIRFNIADDQLILLKSVNFWIQNPDIAQDAGFHQTLDSNIGRRKTTDSGTEMLRSPTAFAMSLMVSDITTSGLTSARMTDLQPLYDFCVAEGIVYHHNVSPNSTAGCLILYQLNQATPEERMYCLERQKVSN